MYLCGINYFLGVEGTGDMEGPGEPRQSREKEDDPGFVRSQALLKDFRIIFRSVQDHSRTVEKESGISSAQLWMLWELFSEPGLTVSALARVLSIHQSTSSNMLDKIQKKGLVFRDRSLDDQRIVRLYLPDTGAALLAKAPRPAQGALFDVLLHLPDKVLSELESGLHQLIDALIVVDEKAAMVPITEENVN
jgi:DNA-binding MarR family transcriptional regulator